MHLTDTGLRSLQAPERSQVWYWDETLPSFGIRVSQGGSKTFVIKHQNRFHTIGRFPILSLADARAEAKRMLAEFTLGRIRPQSLTVTQAIELYLAEKTKNRRARTVQDYRWLLNRHFSFTGQLADVTPAQASHAIAKLPPSQHNHALTAGRVFFNWCRKRRYVTENPLDGISPHRTESRSRVLTDKEIKTLWKQEGKFADYCKLLLLTGQRRGELRRAVVEGDTLVIPADIAKNGRESTVPLTPLARKLFKPFPIFAWAREKKTMGGTWTLHDLRRTFATRLAEMGVAPHIIERLLNHVSGQISGIAAVYNRARYLDEMRAALGLWEKRLTTLLR